jgi:hypothetical protein
MTDTSRPPSPNFEPVRLREIIKDIISWFIQEIKTSESASVIEKELVEPLLTLILSKLFPYIVTSSIVFLLAIVCVVLLITWFLPKAFLAANKITIPSLS